MKRPMFAKTAIVLFAIGLLVFGPQLARHNALAQTPPSHKLFLPLMMGPVPVETTMRIDQAVAWPLANNISLSPNISADGRYVFFKSTATNLVENNSSATWRVFVYDRQTGSINCVTVSTAGTQANDDIGSYSISADGRYIAFESNATNLVPNDSNETRDVFLHDRQTATTTRISVGPGGAQANNGSGKPTITADGRYVFFSSAATNLLAGGNVGGNFIYDRQSATITRIALSASFYDFTISPDGRYIALASGATDLVAGDTNNSDDIFVYDRQAALTTRVSVATSGTQANQRSRAPVISADGRYVVFASEASNLVAGDTNAATDVFLHDRQAGETILISAATGGGLANGGSSAPVFSPDGRYISFDSFASNLIVGDTYNPGSFIYDRQSKTIARFSAPTIDGRMTTDVGLPIFSTDMRSVAFVSKASDLVAEATNHIAHIYVLNLQTNQATAVTRAAAPPQTNSEAVAPSISADGRYVAFMSAASNIVPGDTLDDHSYGVSKFDTFSHSDICLHDRQNAIVTRVTVGPGGTQPNGGSTLPTISGDGRYLAFISAASNLVADDTNNSRDIFLHDRQTNTNTRVAAVSKDPKGPGYSENLSLSADGRYLAFNAENRSLVPGDSNNADDIFVYDRESATISRVSVGAGGQQANGPSGFPVISADGRYVAFWSCASNLVAGDTEKGCDIFIYDRQTTTTTRIAVGDGIWYSGEWFDLGISADVRYVVFASWASTLVANDTNDKADIFVYDRQTATTTRASVATGGLQANGNSIHPSISADGRYVIFMSEASNLVAGDTNDKRDIFVYDRQMGTTRLISAALNNAPANGASNRPSISADGRSIAFDSEASNLVANDYNGVIDIFVRDRGRSTP